ncbi:MAG: hypothetical protein HXX14_04735 [Bacteroidetes bacterium]|nr:hypothetical protein [Bacteroidota bacterium]
MTELYVVALSWSSPELSEGFFSFTLKIKIFQYTHKNRGICTRSLPVLYGICTRSLPLRGRERVQIPYSKAIDLLLLGLVIGLMLK